MFISDAYAQTATGGSSGMAGLLGSPIVPVVLMFVVFYFLLIRPQQSQAKELKVRLSKLTRGDRIVTAGGVNGVVRKAAEGDANIDVEIAPNVVVSVVRSTVTTVVAAKAEKTDKA